MRNRICLVPGCSRLNWTAETCLTHRLSGAATAQDPQSMSRTHPTSDWWDAALPRIEQLWRVRRTESRRRSDRARDELAALHARALPHLIDRAVRRWQHEYNAPGWRLPASRWLSTAVHELAPTMVEPSTWTTLGVSAFEHEARRLLEESDPTPEPFAPVTSPRRGVHTTHHDALRAQERRNAPALRRHAQALSAWVGPSQSSGMNALFSDTDLDTSLPDGLVCFHMIAKRGQAGGVLGALQTWSDWAVDKHLRLQPGDIVRYRHVRGSTLRSYWFTSIAPACWLDTRTEPAWALRLELAPRQGLFIGTNTRSLISDGQDKRDEHEVVLPPNTFWRVVGHRDIVMDDSRDDRWSDWHRVHTVQLIEIPATETRGHPVVDLSYDLPNARSVS